MRSDHEADLNCSRHGRPYPYGTAVWRPLHHPGARNIPAAVRPWIGLESSMTARLREHFGAEVMVHVLANGIGMVHPDEQHFFSPRLSRACVREVVLHAPRHPLLVARTVFSRDCLQAVPALSTLGSRPLGELLFASGAAQWRAREYGRITPRTILSPLVKKGAGRNIFSCWARRTLFLLEGHALLVTEVFLPSMFSLPAERETDSPSAAAADAGNASPLMAGTEPRDESLCFAQQNTPAPFHHRIRGSP